MRAGGLAVEAAREREQLGACDHEAGVLAALGCDRVVAGPLGIRARDDAIGALGADAGEIAAALGGKARAPPCA